MDYCLLHGEQAAVDKTYVPTFKACCIYDVQNNPLLQLFHGYHRYSVHCEVKCFKGEGVGAAQVGLGGVVTYARRELGFCEIHECSTAIFLVCCA